MGQEARPTELGFVWYFRRQGFHAAGIVAIGGELLLATTYMEEHLAPAGLIAPAGLLPRPAGRAIVRITQL